MLRAGRGANDQLSGSGGQIGRNHGVDLLHAGKARGHACIERDQVLPVGDLHGDGGAGGDAGGEDLKDASGLGGGSGLVFGVVLVEYATRENSGSDGSQRHRLRRAARAIHRHHQDG